MKQREMQKPLVQSALVILGVILLIGFVAGSDAQGIFGGIGSMVKGVFLSILFAIALALALVVSVICLFAIFLGAVALYSQETARDMYAKLLQSLKTLYTTWFPAKTYAEDETEATSAETVENPSEVAAATTSQTPVAVQPPPEPAKDLIAELREELSQEINTVGSSVTKLDEQNKTLDSSFAELKAAIETSPSVDVLRKFEEIDAQQSDLSQKLSDCLEVLEKVRSVADEGIKLARKNQDDLDTIKSEMSTHASSVDELRKKLEESSDDPAQIAENHRIFNYIENDGDKKKFSELIAEAISHEMTYAEIDDFLSKSLSKDIDTVIKEHPSLTKQYIRDCKNR